MSFLQQLSNHYHNLVPFDEESNEGTKKKFNILDVEGLMYKETYTDWMCFTETGDIIIPITDGENIKIAKNNLGSIVFREKNSSIQYNGEDYPIPNISFQETKKVFESFKIFHQDGRIEMFESITDSERVEDWIVNTPINWKKIIFYSIAALFFIGWFIDSPSDLSDIESRQEGVEIINELSEDYFDEYKELSDEFISNGTLSDKKHHEMDDIKAKFLEMKYNVDYSDLPYEDKTYLVELIYSNWDDITEKTTANWKLNAYGESALTTENVESTTSTENVESTTSIEFAEEAFDFGTITQGEKVNHAFKFTNTGESDLVIVSARGSCGCIVPEWPKEPISPGESGDIQVIFSSKGKKGKQHKRVSIFANTEPATSVIDIKGEILTPDAEPEAPVEEETTEQTES